MKKRGFACLLALSMMASCFMAQAEEAPDLKVRLEAKAQIAAEIAELKVGLEGLSDLSNTVSGYQLELTWDAEGLQFEEFVPAMENWDVQTGTEEGKLIIVADDDNVDGAELTKDAVLGAVKFIVLDDTKDWPVKLNLVDICNDQAEAYEKIAGIEGGVYADEVPDIPEPGEPGDDGGDGAVTGQDLALIAVMVVVAAGAAVTLVMVSKRRKAGDRK